MNKSRLAQLGAWLLGTVFLCILIAQFSKGLSFASQSSHQAEIISELVEADIVYLGETHDSLEDHQAQLQIITALYAEDPQMAIALEMFQRPFQPAIDQYLAGEINESELQQQTEYDQRWGFEWEYYAPILRFAQAHQLPVLALNTPTEVTRQVARQGLESLTPDQQQYIPPLAEIRTDNLDYRQMIQQVYQFHGHSGENDSEGFERFFAAQVLWDETMAEKVAEFWQENPEYQVIVLAGEGHIIYGYGIPSRVARRLDESVVQRSVLLSSPEVLESKEKPPADYFWQPL